MTKMTSFPRALLHLLIAAYVYNAVQAQTLRDAKPSLIVEPFIAQWCAYQFPEELSDSFNGFAMASLLEEGSHVNLEPFLGGWCFDQFPEEFQASNRSEAIRNTDTNHKQIEPYLQEWGERSMLPAPKFHMLEPYIGRWCAAQFPRELKERSKDAQAFEDSIKAKQVNLEPALAKWCFHQFREPLASKDTPATLADIDANHVLIENSLIQWGMSTQAAAKSSKTSGGLVAWATIATVALVGILAVLAFKKYRGENDTTPPRLSVRSGVQMS